MRTYLRELTELGVVERKQEAGFPGSVEFRITPSGEGLLAVGETLQRWLDYAPGGPIALGTVAAKSATKALVDGWSTGIVRALAARPFALTELHRLLPQLSYPSLERRLTAMRVIGQVEALPDRASRGTPYKATEWLRRGVVPLAAAISWEGCWIPKETRAINRMDVEAAFLLSVPLLELPSDLSGVCRLAVELRNGSEVDYAGAKVTVEGGKVVSCLTRLSGDVDAWVSGSPADWLHQGNGSREDCFEVGGEASLARALLDAFPATLPPRDLAGVAR